MNFTREPIIETVITPREGCKLVVRSSKGANQEDYFVDAVEVVSFGHSFFFRSLERPKSFLVPVSDYEILELKETRMVLKNMGSERSIKIGGGRDMSVRSPREAPEESYSETPAEVESAAPEQQQVERMDKKQGRRRSRRRRGGGGGQMESSMEGKRTEASSVAEYPEEQESPTQSGGAERVEEAAPSFISKLFPPPPTLIKETLSRYKTSEEGIVLEEKAALHEELFEHPTAEEESAFPDKDSDEETEE